MSERFKILGVVIAALVIGVILFPPAVSAWFLNAANAQIARATTADSPERAVALANANTYITQARQFANEPRLSLAQARVLLAHGEAAWVGKALANVVLDDDPIVQFIRADTAWQLRETEVAFAHWRAAGAFVYFVNQAYRALDKHEWRDAENFARIAVGIAPDQADAHYALGDALSRQNIADPAALRELKRTESLTRDPDIKSRALSRQGEILAEQDELRDALEMFQRARGIAPLDARPRTGYALTKLQLDPGARDESVALLEQVVGDSPWYTSAYIALSQIAEENSDALGAETWLKTGLAQNPNDPRLLLPLGELYARQNRVTDAKEMLAFALKHETHTDSRQAITRALEKLQ